MAPRSSSSKKSSSSSSTTVSRSTAAGLTFPVGRTARLLRARVKPRRVARDADVAFAAVVESVTAAAFDTILAYARTKLADDKRLHLTPRVLIALYRDEAFHGVMQNFRIAGVAADPDARIRASSSSAKKEKVAAAAADGDGSSNKSA